ncbi:MAG: amidohydrolase family protein [Thaumarchaeota archaeon]|nr:amidohydrolase family protein [Nitrososphaerota archaeon]
MSVTALVNIGTVVTGELSHPLLDGKDTVVIENRRISSICERKDFKPKSRDSVIDVKGMTVIPGLVDSHTHPTIGDWSPRFRAVGYLKETLFGGVVAMISNGEVHLEGRPKDTSGIKALAILAKKAFDNFQPGGMRVYGGALSLDAPFSDEDFEELREEGVWLIGEAGRTTLTLEEIVELVKTARRHGMKIACHCGGRSPDEGARDVAAEDVVRISPDVASHVNGGPISMKLEDIKKIVSGTKIAVEICYGGNLKTAVEAAELVKKHNALDRTIVGSDSPSGAADLGCKSILRTLTLVSSMAGIPGSKTVCLATGNTKKVFGIDEGLLKEGAPACLAVGDRSHGSAARDMLNSFEIGDLPGIAMVIAGGEITIPPPSHIPPPAKRCKISIV